MADTATKAEEPKPAETPDALKPENYPEEGFRDVSKEADADPDDTEAQAVVNAEMSHRATAQSNGGGPWPPEVLQERFIDAGQSVMAPLPQYTSHEEAESESKSSTKKK